MPPKAAKNNAKVDKKKEEAERKAKEEAEQAEREERERLEIEEKERLEREEQERQRVEEEARFLEETSRINEMLDKRNEILDKWKLQQWESKQWDSYASCRSLPDPSNEKSFNTYLSLCEESCVVGKPDIQETFRKIKEYFQLCSEIEALLHSDGLPQPTDTDIDRYKKAIPRLHKLVLSKLDFAALEYMQEAEKHVDTETYNLRVEAKSGEGLVFCLWGNVVKNPRLKSFSFQDHLKLTLDIPKPLLLADAAVRVIQLPFDPLSPLSQSFQCKRSPPSTSLSTQSKSSGKGSESEAPSNQGDNSPLEDGEGTSTVDNNTESPEESTQQEEATEVSVVDQGNGETKEQEQSDPIQTTNNEASGTDEGGERSDAGEAGDASEGGERGDAGEGGESGEGMEADEVNLRAFIPARGPIVFQLLEMPPQPKSVNNWTFRKVVPSYLVPFPYPAEVPRPPPSASEEEQAAAPPPPTPGSSAWPPITITMQLPDQFLFSEEPKLAQWDEEKSLWRTSGFENVNCDLEEKTISFQTFYFRPLALMVDRYANMPYLSWSMLPCGTNHTLLTIEGGAVEISVEIKEHVSTLVGPTEVPALAHIIKKPMSARQLIQALSCTGIGFFPALDADKYVSITPKHYMVEQSIYQSMSLASCGVAFQWSRWNSEADRRHVVLRAVQAQVSLDNVAVDQLQWSTYVGGRKNFKVAITEESSEFSMKRSEGCELHPSLFSTLEHESSPQTAEKLKETSPMHSDAVMYWLTSVRMLTFS